MVKVKKEKGGGGRKEYNLQRLLHDERNDQWSAETNRLKN